MIRWIIDVYSDYFNTPEMQRTKGQELKVELVSIALFILFVLIAYGVLWLKISYSDYKKRRAYGTAQKHKDDEPIEDDTEEWLNRRKDTKEETPDDIANEEEPDYFDRISKDNRPICKDEESE